MGEQDIDQLQSFGAKIAQKNQDNTPKKKMKLNSMIESKKTKDNLNQSVKKGLGHIKKRTKHFLRKILIKSKAFFSPYVIKLQTKSKYKKDYSQKQYIKRKRLIEKRKRFGNTIIVIRRWKKVSLPVQEDLDQSAIQHVYYFHQKNQKKKKFQPKKSIWDVPIIFDKK